MRRTAQRGGFRSFGKGHRSASLWAIKTGKEDIKMCKNSTSWGNLIKLIIAILSALLGAVGGSAISMP